MYLGVYLAHSAQVALEINTIAESCAPAYVSHHFSCLNDYMHTELVRYAFAIWRPILYQNLWQKILKSKSVHNWLI